MKNSLSKEEADDTVKSILPMIKIRIKKSELNVGDVSFDELMKINPAVKRYGNISDTYCKISESAFNHGLATELRTYGMGNLFIQFWKAGKYYNPPSKETCHKRWEDVIHIGVLRPKPSQP